jgi:hypothetical protein
MAAAADSLGSTTKLFFAIMLAIGVFALTSVTCLAGDIAGCYQLQLSPWTPPLSLGDDEAFIVPPSRIELTTTPDHIWDKHGFKVTPAGGVDPSVHKFSYWTRHDNQVHIVWTTGHAGLTMDLQVHDSSLVGTAQTFWDFSRPKQTNHVVATKIPCGNK